MSRASRAALALLPLLEPLARLAGALLRRKAPADVSPEERARLADGAGRRLDDAIHKRTGR